MDWDKKDVLLGVFLIFFWEIIRGSPTKYYSYLFSYGLKKFKQKISILYNFNWSWEIYVPFCLRMLQIVVDSALHQNLGKPGGVTQNIEASLLFPGMYLL